VARAEKLARKPVSLTFEQAAVVWHQARPDDATSPRTTSDRLSTSLRAPARAPSPAHRARRRDATRGPGLARRVPACPTSASPDRPSKPATHNPTKPGDHFQHPTASRVPYQRVPRPRSSSPS
jgi:hypothetical protein